MFSRVKVCGSTRRPWAMFWRVTEGWLLPFPTGHILLLTFFLARSKGRRCEAGPKIRRKKAQARKSAYWKWKGSALRDSEKSSATGSTPERKSSTRGGNKVQKRAGGLQTEEEKHSEASLKPARGERPVQGTQCVESISGRQPQLRTSPGAI